MSIQSFLTVSGTDLRLSRTTSLEFSPKHHLKEPEVLIVVVPEQVKNEKKICHNYNGIPPPPRGCFGLQRAAGWGWGGFGRNGVHLFDAFFLAGFSIVFQKLFAMKLSSVFGLYLFLTPVLPYSGWLGSFFFFFPRSEWGLWAGEIPHFSQEPLVALFPPFFPFPFFFTGNVRCLGRGGQCLTLI